MYLHEKRQPRIDLSQDALGLRKDPVQGFGCGGAEVMPAEGKAKVRKSPINGQPLHGAVLGQGRMAGHHEGATCDDVNVAALLLQKPECGRHLIQTLTGIPNHEETPREDSGRVGLYEDLPGDFEVDSLAHPVQCFLAA